MRYACKAPTGDTGAWHAAQQQLQHHRTNGAKEVKRILFVGNSHTYQPKELGGLPSVVAKIATAVSATELSCESVVKGGADLVDLWEDFQAAVLKQCDSKGSAHWDAVVLQVGRGVDQHSQFPVLQALEKCYAPLLVQTHGQIPVVLYQTWSGPRPGVDEAELLALGVETSRVALQAGGVCDVRLALAGHAFLAIRDAVGARDPLYSALWKDDSGHASALAGVLVGAVVLHSLGYVPGSPSRPLSQILEALLPHAWRTASPGFASGDVAADMGQRTWGEAARGAPAELMKTLAAMEQDQPLSKYPPGLRTEKRALGFVVGETLANAVAVAVAATSPCRVAAEHALASAAAEHGAGCNTIEPTSEAAAALSESALVKETAPARTRRWRAK